MVYKLSIVGPKKQVIAYKYGTDDAGEKWLDPHGGDFSEDELGNMDRITDGTRDYLTLHRNTVHESQFIARLVAEFK